MKKNLQTLAVPAVIATGFLFGCASPPGITERTDSTRPAVVLVQEGYDTFGRKWDDETKSTIILTAPAANPRMLTRDDSELIQFTGTITDIDYTNRELTLKDQQGRIETFSVDRKVLRFNEAKVGDKVSMGYYLGFNAEVRKPTAEELQNPLVVQEATGKAGQDAAPAAGDLRQIRAVVTIEGLDRRSQTLTVKGPRGRYFVARVADPSRLEQVRIGETIVMTFTEAAAISLEKVGN